MKVMVAPSTGAPLYFSVTVTGLIGRRLPELQPTSAMSRMWSSVRIANLELTDFVASVNGSERPPDAVGAFGAGADGRGRFVAGVDVLTDEMNRAIREGGIHSPWMVTARAQDPAVCIGIHVSIVDATGTVGRQNRVERAAFRLPIAPERTEPRLDRDTQHSIAGNLSVARAWIRVHRTDR